MKLLHRLAFGLALAGAAFAPFVSVAQTSQAPSADSFPYSYNRITDDFAVQNDGTVQTQELLTILYNEPQHMTWRGVVVSSTTPVTDVTVADGTTGQPLTFSPTPLDPTATSSWNKYTSYVKDGTLHIEWYYDTTDHVHTWILGYTLHGALTANDTQLSRTLFSDYGTPVDTVEAEIHIPDTATAERSNLFTTDSHDFYIDRPDAHTFRYRVSDIGPNEEVGIFASWNAGTSSPASLVSGLGTGLGANSKVGRYLYIGAGIVGALVLLAIGFLGGSFWAKWKGKRAQEVKENSGKL